MGVALSKCGGRRPTIRCTIWDLLDVGVGRVEHDRRLFAERKAWLPGVHTEHVGQAQPLCQLPSVKISEPRAWM